MCSTATAWVWPPFQTSCMCIHQWPSASVAPRARVHFVQRARFGSWKLPKLSKRCWILHPHDTRFQMPSRMASSEGKLFNESVRSVRGKAHWWQPRVWVWDRHPRSECLGVLCPCLRSALPFRCRRRSQFVANCWVGDGADGIWSRNVIDALWQRWRPYLHYDQLCAHLHNPIALKVWYINFKSETQVRRVKRCVI